MFKKIILYEFFLYWQVSQIINVYCDSQSKNFKKYLINSLNHIRVQNGWDSIQQTEIKLDHFSINTISITNEIIDGNNFIQKLYFITCFLNCEFTNIMQTFNSMIGLILNKCEVTVLNNQCTELKYFTNLIINIFKCSVNMFQIMLKTAKYLDKIDLRIIDSPTLNIKTVDSEINYFYTYALDLSKDSYNISSIDRLVNTFENIKDFNIKAEFVTSNLYKIRKVCGIEYKSSILINLMMKNNIDKIEKLEEVSYDYIYDIHKDLELYILGRTENCYSKLGFEQLYGTNTFKYIHYNSNKYRVGEGIKLCNHLISHAGWMSWKHIAVETNPTKGISLYFKDIVRTVDKNNYYFIRSYLALILRCRYIEIFDNFNVMLGHIINICKYENKINCAVRLYETLMSSDDMFKKMLFALTTLRHYTKDRRQYIRQELLTEKVVEFFIDFLYDVRKKYFSTLLFINGGLYEAQSFLEDVDHVYTLILQGKFYDVIQNNMKYCKIMKCETDIITTFEQLIQTNTLTEYSTLHVMCDYLESFFLKVVKNDYEYLGFNDLPCRY